MGRRLAGLNSLQRAAIMVALVVVFVGAGMLVLPFRVGSNECGAPLFGADTIRTSRVSGGENLLQRRTGSGCRPAGNRQKTTALVVVTGGVLIGAAGVVLAGDRPGART